MLTLKLTSKAPENGGLEYVGILEIVSSWASLADVQGLWLLVSGRSGRVTLKLTAKAP